MPNLFEQLHLPLDVWLQAFADRSVGVLRPATQAAQVPIGVALDFIQHVLTSANPLVIIAIFLAAGWYGGGAITGLFSAAALLFIGMIGLWNDTMTTLSIVIVSVVFTVLIGLFLAIIAAQHRRFWAVLRTVLDVMQSTPSFVYLVPVVMLFGIGTVPGVIATMIFAVPPMVKITYLGLTQIPEELIEVGDSFGASRRQTLINVRLPLAMPSIATGLNQVIMFSLVMSTIVSMIGAEGLGAVVLRGVGRMDIGTAGSAGLAIVFLALSLDRMSKRLGRKKGITVRRPRGFLSLVRKMKSDYAYRSKKLPLS
ncbi:ABC transporter permease subunit [Caballeronia sp. LjRoot34]|uniref:ABC transporter permease n=1 Tax=Caballeronia sp. LjRoot34 TaxID=3342325 RepID=UPI003ECC8742